MSTDSSETVATYTVGGKTYEIDHLGINYPEQWGEFAVYHDGQQIADFGIEEMCLARAPLPNAEALIRGALWALAEDAGENDGPIYPQPGAPIPLELNGGMAGFVVGECQHRVGGSEWRAGFRNCERCGG